MTDVYFCSTKDNDMTVKVGKVEFICNPKRLLVKDEKKSATTSLTTEKMIKFDKGQPYYELPDRNMLGVKKFKLHDGLCKDSEKYLYYLYPFQGININGRIQYNKQQFLFMFKTQDAKVRNIAYNKTERTKVEFFKKGGFTTDDSIQNKNNTKNVNVNVNKSIVDKKSDTNKTTVNPNESSVYTATDIKPEKVIVPIYKYGYFYELSVFDEITWEKLRTWAGKSIL